jgi:hypothetical protein
MSTQAQPEPQQAPATTTEATALDQIVEKTQAQVSQTALFQREQFLFKQRLASLFALSGLFTDSGTKERPLSKEEAIAQAFVKIELGESMGFTPAESMQGIDIIKGRPAIGAHLRATRMKAAGYDWQFARHDEKGCKVFLFRNGKPLLNKDGSQANCEFTEAEANRINKGRDGTLKDNWKNAPKNMYFARTITNAQRWFASEVLNVRILSTEEAIDLEDVIAETNARPVEPQRKSKTAEKPPAPPADIPEVTTLPEAFEMPPGTRVSFQGGIWEPSEDRTGWRVVDAAVRK